MNCLLGGLILQFLGGLLASFQIFGTGTAPLAAAGLVVVGAGTLLLLVAIIGYGVQLGIRADREQLRNDGASQE